jgi:thiol:disulfide interchange protein DsbA
MVALLATAGCGQSENTGSAATAPTPANQVAESAPSETVAQESAPAALSEPAADRIEMAQADMSSVAAAGYMEGRHYQRISPTQPVNTSPGQVEVNEFFMHTCPHCRTLEPYVEAWLEDKPDFINFVRVPTTWSDLNTVHAQAYYTAESLGIADEIMSPFFAELHDRGNALESADKLASLFSRFDVTRADFDSHFGSFSVMTKVSNATVLGQRYRIDSTPTIVINGKYKTGVDQAGGFVQLFVLIELLAAAERSQGAGSLPSSSCGSSTPYGAAWMMSSARGTGAMSCASTGSVF